MLASVGTCRKSSLRSRAAYCLVAPCFEALPIAWAYRERSLPLEYIPELEAAATKAGLKWTDFQMTDNTCKPHPPAKSILEKVVLFWEQSCCVFASHVFASVQLSSLVRRSKVVSNVQLRLGGREWQVSHS